MKKAILFLVILGIIGAAVYYSYYSTAQISGSAENPSTETDEIRPVPQEDLHGFIEGSLSYPSEGFPENLVICAEPYLEDIENAFCTSTLIDDEKYDYGKGYKIEVPVGTYLVYSYVEGSDGYKAYYSEFVNCGYTVDCPDHNPIPVEVVAGETSMADPNDWYITPSE